MKEIKGLTGLRGYAALWVFFLHATWEWPGNGFLIQIARHGGSGVLVFFVLSGFILSYVYAQKFADRTTTYRRFLTARFARIYPLHAFVLLAYAALAAYGLVGLLPSDNLYTFALNLGLVQAWGMLPTVSWNQSAWSISVEAFAYLLFPFLAARLYRASTRALIVAAAVVIFWVFINPFSKALMLATYHAWVLPPTGRFSHAGCLVAMLGVFANGVVLYCLSRRLCAKGRKPILHDVSTACGLLVLLCTCLFSGNSDPWITIGSLLIIFGLSSDSGVGKFVFGNPVAYFLGRISYALYLSGAAVEYPARHFLYPLPLWVNILLALAVASMLHVFVEMPARRFLTARSRVHHPGVGIPL